MQLARISEKDMESDEERQIVPRKHLVEIKGVLRGKRKRISNMFLEVIPPMHSQWTFSSNILQ